MGQGSVYVQAAELCWGLGKELWHRAPNSARPCEALLARVPPPSPAPCSHHRDPAPSCLPSGSTSSTPQTHAPGHPPAGHASVTLGLASGATLRTMRGVSFSVSLSSSSVSSSAEHVV